MTASEVETVAVRAFGAGPAGWQVLRPQRSHFGLLHPGTRVHGGAGARTTTPSLTLTGGVVMHTTKMSAKLLGVPLTFTPERPPPLTLPTMVMTDVVSEQPMVRANGTRISTLGITAS